MTGQQLKNSILQMAVQGKLVPQDPNDEPASVLLERIRAEKETLIKAGKIKKEKNPSVIFRGADNLPYEKVGKNEPVCIANEVPFEIPDSWEWVRLGDYAEKVTDQVASGSFASLRANVPSLKEPDYAIMVKTADFSNGFTRNLTYTTKHGYDFLENSNLFGGELILSNIGSIGKCFIVPKLDCKMTLAPNSVMIRLTDERLRDYLYNFILSPQGFMALTSITSGTAMKKFNKTDLKTILIPVPPLEEQTRIVNKIEELQQYIDQYTLTEIKLSKLNLAFPELLKKSILQEAIQGKLVPQDPNDEPASVLLERIRAEKQRLIKEGKIKKDKHESVSFRRDNSHYEKRGSEEVCIDEELPFDIPSSWEWCRIGSLFQVNPRNDISDDTDVGFIPMALIKDGFRNEHTFEERKWKNIKSGFTHFADGDIVVAKITPCFQNRKSAIISQLPSGIGAGTTELHVIRDVTSMLFMPYFLLIFKTNDFIENGVKNFSGTAGQQRIGKDYISDYLVPIPPINEQVRIVDTVMKAFSNIDDLYD